MTPGEARKVITAPVTFEVLGYGSTCQACGALVVGEDGRAQHRRHHEAGAVLAQSR